MGGKLLLCVCKVVATMGLVYSFLLAKHVALSLPLSTSSQWIVDEPTGSRVKLACVNWASHLSPMFAEGLHLHPLESIAHTIPSWGFNCVRLSRATYMFTNKTLGEASVAQTFKDLRLVEELQGLASFNGKLVGMTCVEAFQEVVRALGREGVMVVLDNCARTPGWGCGGNADHNVGDASFEAQIWLQGLQTVASLFKGWPNVVGISFRYEHQSPQDWFRQMQRGAEAIHNENPDLLVIHGGLSSKQDFYFLTEALLSDTLKHKVVYELQFANSEGVAGALCGAVMEEMREDVGFLTTANITYTSPVIVGEFGVDQRGGLSANDAPCFFAFAARGDMDWAVWPLQGSYYLRGGVRDDDESFGLFNHQWSAPRNAPLLQKLQALQLPFIQDIRRKPHAVLFHPATGRCVNKVNMNGLEMGSCRKASSWKLTPQGLITLDSTYLVIGAQGPAQPAVLALQGMQSNGPWTLLNSSSSQYMQVSTVLSEQTLCLDAPSPPNLLTNPCTCLYGTPSSLPGQQHCKNNPTSQWFIFIHRTSN